MDETWLDDRHLFLTDALSAAARLPRSPRRRRHAWGSRARPCGRWCARARATDAPEASTSRRRRPTTSTSRAHAASVWSCPTAAVVTDRTAAWLHGVDLLPRARDRTPPPVNVFHTTDTRVRRPGSRGRPTRASGQRHHRGPRRSGSPRRCGPRWISAGCSGGTTPSPRSTGSCASASRTSCSSRRSVASGLPRRAQLRAWRRSGTVAPSRRVSPHSGCTGTTPACRGPSSSSGSTTTTASPIYRLDIAAPGRCCYAAEYDGEEFHTQRRGPGARRGAAGVVRDETAHWIFEVFTKVDVYDRTAGSAARGWQAGYPARSRDGPCGRRTAGDE